MRRKLFIAAFLLAGMSACKKDDNPTPVKTSYFLTGITDRTIQKSIVGPPASAFMELGVVYEHSEQETVSLTMENMPTGLKHKFFSKSGIPTFTSELELIDSGVAPGDYTLRLVSTGSKTGRRSFDFGLSVLAIPQCNEDVTGTGYATQSNCTTGGASYSQNVTSVAGETSRVLFSNFDNTGAQVYGLVICPNRQIMIPAQTVNGVRYEGFANYHDNLRVRTINVNFNKVSGGFTTSCSLRLTK